MFEGDSTNALAIVIATSPCDHLPATISCVDRLVIFALVERTVGLWIGRDVCVDLDLGPMIPSMDAMVLCEES